jgi:acyl-CoA thioester hydrolase
MSSKTHYFDWPLRVYWEDTDAGGVVFYANYLKYFERGRTELFRSLGYEQEALRVSGEMLFLVADTQIQYKKPARLDDAIVIRTRIAECKGASLLFDQTALSQSQDTLCCSQIRVACVDSLLRPKRLPKSLIHALAPFLSL